MDPEIVRRACHVAALHHLLILLDEGDEDLGFMDLVVLGFGLTRLYVFRLSNILINIAEDHTVAVLDLVGVLRRVDPDIREALRGRHERALAVVVERLAQHVVLVQVRLICLVVGRALITSHTATDLTLQIKFHIALALQLRPEVHIILLTAGTRRHQLAPRERAHGPLLDEALRPRVPVLWVHHACILHVANLTQRLPLVQPHHRPRPNHALAHLLRPLQVTLRH